QTPNHIKQTTPLSSSGTPVFVEKGQDVRLDVQGYMTVKNNLKRLNRFQWRFNTSDNVVTYTHEIETQVTPKYQGRAEFIDGNFSLLLKNLKEGDSGCYTAAVRAEKNQDVAKYQISVQERVEPPVLTVDSNSTINAICNVTVTCRGQKTSVVTSLCNSRICSQVGGESRGAETSTVPLLSVYVAGGSIICNHSNQVSWASDTKEIETICVSKSGKTCTRACTHKHSHTHTHTHTHTNTHTHTLYALLTLRLYFQERDKADHNNAVTVRIQSPVIIIIFVGCALIRW
uniref:Immunoglobulin V-set domain-containing protein n=1 Tax=Salmo trutta TaxID=8032 RepID=A0A674CSW5_SALTR